MTRVADRETPAGFEKRSDDRGGEDRVPRHGGELPVEQPHEFGLIQTVHEAPHERSQVGRRGRDGVSMTRHVRQQQAADTTCGATGSIINVAARMGLAVRLAVDPGVQSSEFDAARGELATAPDLHALHVLRRLWVHCWLHAGFYFSFW